MWVAHQIDACTPVVFELGEQTAVEWLLRHKGVAEVRLTWHEIHVHSLSELVDERLKAVHHIADLAVDFSVGFGCAVAASQHLVHLFSRYHRVTGDHKSSDLRCELLVGGVK